MHTSQELDIVKLPANSQRWEGHFYTQMKNLPHIRIQLISGRLYYGPYSFQILPQKVQQINNIYRNSKTWRWICFSL